MVMIDESAAVAAPFIPQAKLRIDGLGDIYLSELERISSKSASHVSPV
jgi:hypothetical protein